MGLKGYIILFLILLLIPVFLGKVGVGQFSDFFKAPSWDGFKSAFGKLLTDDFNFYKELVTPWIEKLIDFIKDKIKASI
jgi:hypothetical protein